MRTVLTRKVGLFAVHTPAVVEEAVEAGAGEVLGAVGGSEAVVGGAEVEVVADGVVISDVGGVGVVAVTHPPHRAPMAAGSCSSIKASFTSTVSSSSRSASSTDTVGVHA